jgi:CelD/BcsL family acetyltransferase involved in cellulose biosynthesis
MESKRPKLAWRLAPIDQFAAFAPDWEKLALPYRTAPFLLPDFVEPLIRHFGTGREQLAVGRTNGEILALAILTHAGAGRRNTFQPSQLPLGPIVLAPGLAVEVALDAMLRQLPISTLAVGLTQLDSSIYGMPPDAGNLATSPYIRTAWVDVEGTFENYWNSRGKNLRQNMRKQRRKLEEDGMAARLEVLRDPASVAGAIENYGRLESAGWKSAEGTAVHPDNPQGRFYRQMLERFCARGRGCIYRYSFGDKTVALDLCIESDDTIVILKTTYDENYKTLSPAFLMREESFTRIWQEGRIRRIEFFGKLMDWHKRWTDNARDLYHLTRYRWAWIQRVAQRRASTERLARSDVPA